MADNLNHKDFLNTDALCLRYLLIRIWLKRFNHRPKAVRGFENEVEELIDDLKKVGKYDIVLPEKRRDSQPSGLDNIVDKINSGLIFTIGARKSYFDEKWIDVLCSYYYENPIYPSENREDWEKLKVEYNKYIQLATPDNNLNEKLQEELNIVNSKLKISIEENIKLKASKKDLTLQRQQSEKDYETINEKKLLLEKINIELEKSIGEKDKILFPEIETGEAEQIRVFSFNLCSPKSFISMVSALCVLVIIIGIGSCYFVESSIALIPISTGNIIISIVHIVVLVFLIFLYVREYSSEKIEGNLIKQTILHFESAWMGILTALSFQYLWFSLEWWLQKLNTSVFLSIGDLLTSISSFLFYYTYCILETKSLNTSDNLNRNKYFRINISISALICVILCAASIITQFEDPQPLIMRLLFAIYPAITISLFIERISSRTLILSRPIIPFLFAYCALQVGYVFKAGPIFFLILSAALILKIVLIIVVYKIIDDNRIERYLKEVLFVIRK